MPFRTPDEFLAMLKCIGLDPYVEDQIARTYDDAKVLSFILNHGEYNAADHKVAYQVVGGSNSGMALGLSARVALNTGGNTLDAFAASLRLEGFRKALDAFTKRLWHSEFDWKETLPWVQKALVGSDEVAAQFWLNRCLVESEDSSAYMAHFVESGCRLMDAKRKAASSGTKRRPAEFKRAIELYWVVAALWCRTDAGIAQFLAEGPATEAQTKRVRNDVSALGFSPSRCPDLESFVDEATHFWDYK